MSSHFPKKRVVPTRILLLLLIVIQIQIQIRFDHQSIIVVFLSKTKYYYSNIATDWCVFPLVRRWNHRIYNAHYRNAELLLVVVGSKIGNSRAKLATVVVPYGRSININIAIYEISTERDWCPNSIIRLTFLQCVVPQ